MLIVIPFCYCKSTPIVVRFCAANSSLAMLGVSYGKLFVRPLCYNNSSPMVVGLYAASATLAMSILH